jgi:acetyltransferase-like isoleucine patch superfamily enzyme
MCLDQWIIQQLARVFYFRYADALRGEAHKWDRLREENRIDRLKKSLAECGEDVTIRAGAEITVPENVHIGHHVAIGYHTLLRGYAGITLENFVLLGDNVILSTSSHPIDAVHFHNYWGKPILIQENAWLGAGVIVLPGVTIGENATIGAGAVVTEDIPANAVAVGVPAKVIRTIDFDAEDLRDQKRSTREIRLRRVGLDSDVDAIF